MEKPQSRDRNQPSRRRTLRFAVQAPLDVTVLRSGVPDTVPGRSENLGAGGMAAVLAGELKPGQSVGVEIRFPPGASPFRLRALVRHQHNLRCGMQFVGLSPAQKATLRAWTREMKAESDDRLPPLSTNKAPEPALSAGSSGHAPIPGSDPVTASVTSSAVSSSEEPTREPSATQHPSLVARVTQFSRGWLFLIVSAAILLAVLWWRWDRGWEDLEAGLRRNDEPPQPEVHVPADVMEKLVTHRVDPDYPDDARAGRLHGVIVLDVVVGSDGAVAEVRPLNGPDILAQSASDALRWWRFKPYVVDGKPIVAETTVAVEFKP